jgi:hypothetical protein
MTEGFTATNGDMGMLLLKAVCEHDTAMVAFAIVKPIAATVSFSLPASSSRGMTQSDLTGA